MTSGKSDQAKGRVKEAAGVLTGNKKMEREGKADQVAGKLKQAVGKAKKKVEEVIDEVKDALDGVRVDPRARPAPRVGLPWGSSDGEPCYRRSHTATLARASARSHRGWYFRRRRAGVDGSTRRWGAYPSRVSRRNASRLSFPSGSRFQLMTSLKCVRAAVFMELMQRHRRGLVDHSADPRDSPVRFFERNR